VFNYARHLGEDLDWKEDGRVATRARLVLDQSVELLEKVAAEGLVSAIGKGEFADVKRAQDGGKGLSGVFERGPRYFNPFMTRLEALNGVSMAKV